jgi:hypothetical protein
VKQLVVAFGGTLAAIILWVLLFDGLGATTQVVLACLVIATMIFAVRRWPSIVVSRAVPDVASDVVGVVSGVASDAAPDVATNITSLRAKLDGHQLFVACIAALVAIKSVDVVKNLASHHQAMNRSYDRLALVNTYGAFGSVGMVRHELVIEGTRDADPATARWSAYELPCKPGDLARRPCVLGPYHRRLDWLIWFAAMPDEPRHSWVIHLVWKLLDGDREIRKLVAGDPFDGAAPRYVRIRRFVYHLEPYSSPGWWTRDHEELWLPPIALDTPGLRETLERYGMPSPSLH